MRRIFTAFAACAAVLGLVFLAAHFGFLPARSELDEPTMRHWEKQVGRCGFIYYVLVAAEMEDLVPNLKEKTLAYVKDKGASQVQLIILSDKFDEQQAMAAEEGAKPGMAVSEEDKRVLTRLALVVNDTCTSDVLRFL